jgi:hypothetical protein
MSLKNIDLYLFLFFVCALFLTFAGHGVVVDENMVIQVLDNYFAHGELTVDRMHQALEGADGKYYSRYGFGFSLFLLPFYLMGTVLQYFFGDANVFYRDPQFFCMLIGQLLITAGTGWVLYRICLKLRSGEKVAVLLSLSLIFGTSFWAYSQSLFRLTFSSLILLVTFLVILLYHEKQKKRYLFAIAGLIAYGLNVREDLFIAFICLGMFSWMKGTHRDRFAFFITFFIGGLVGFLLWGAHNYMRFGTFFIEDYIDCVFDYPWMISIPQLLYSKSVGIVTYSPLILLFPFSFLACYREKMLPVWFCGLLIFTIYLCFYASSDMYHGGQCWGPRYMYYIIPFLIPPLIHAVKNSRSMRRILLVFVLIGMTMNWPGLYSYHGKYESYFESPPFFTLLFEYPKHPFVVVYDQDDDFSDDELDFWWVRMIYLKPYSLFPVAFLVLIAMTVYLGAGLWRQLCESEANGSQGILAKRV